MALLCAAAPLRPCEAQLEGGPTIGAPAPQVRTTDLEGREVELGADFGRRPVLIEFWATWCTPCRDLMPSVDSAVARYGDRVSFLGVNVAMNETVAGVRRYLAQHPPSFRVLYDSAATAIRAYDIQATSTVIIVGRDGRVAYAGVGAGQDLSAILGRLLAADTESGSP